MSKEENPDRFEHYREAARVVVGAEYGFRVRHCSIKQIDSHSPKAERAGYYLRPSNLLTSSDCEIRDRELYQKAIIARLAGDEAAKWFSDNENLKPSFRDRYDTFEMADRLLRAESATVDSLRYCEKRAAELMPSWPVNPMIISVAKSLKKKKTLNARQIRKALERASIYAMSLEEDSNASTSGYGTVDDGDVTYESIWVNVNYPKN